MALPSSPNQHLRQIGLGGLWVLIFLKGFYYLKIVSQMLSFGRFTIFFGGGFFYLLTKLTKQRKAVLFSFDNFSSSWGKVRKLINPLTLNFSSFYCFSFLNLKPGKGNKNVSYIMLYPIHNGALKTFFWTKIPNLLVLD